MSVENNISLIGHLTRDAQLSYTQAGLAISKMSIALNYRKKTDNDWREAAMFFDINLFGTKAEKLQQYLVKGKQIAVAGELRQDRWEQDGQRKTKVYIEAQSIKLLGSQNSPQGVPQGQGKPEAPPAEDVFDDDIPF